MSKSRARFLSELLGTTGLVKKAKSALAGADEVIDLDVLPSIPNSKLTNSSITINSSATSLGGSVTLTTANVAENTNLYYTDARADARIVNAGSANWNTAYTYSQVGHLPLAGGTLTGNLSLGGYLAGPATFTIDPAAVGDNTGTVVIAGNLQVDGTTTTINSTTMTVDDLNLTLASGAANAAAANGAGITVDGASATITYNSTGDSWDFNKNVDVSGSVTIDGTTKLDGGTGYFKDGFGNTFNSGWDVNTDDYSTWINYSGYQGGSSKFRDLRIGNGKASTVVFVDGSSGLVGIGSTTMSSYYTSFNDLVVDGGTSSGVTIVSGTTGDGTIAFADGTTGNEQYRGYVQYTHAGDDLKFGVAGAEAMRITSAGNVGIGTNSPASSTGYTVLTLNNATNGGNIVFQSNGTAKGYVYNSSSQFRIEAGASTPIVFANPNGEAARIDASGNVGIGIVPESGWSTTVTVLQFGESGALWGDKSGEDWSYFSSNTYWDGTNFKYKNTNEASYYVQDNQGEHVWAVAPSGSADANITFNQAMKLDQSGKLLLGTTNVAPGSGDVAGSVISPDGYISVSRNAVSAEFNRIGSNGDIIVFRKGGALVGSWQARGDVVSTIILDPRSGGAGLTAAGASLFPTNNAGAVSDGAIDLGYSVSGTNYRFKNLYLSGNVQMGGNLDVVGQISSYDNVGASYGTMNFRASDYIYKNGGGTPKMVLDSSGNVGIGTTSPGQKLVVQGSNHIATLLNTSTATNAYSQLMLQAGSSTNYIWTQNQNSTNYGGAHSLNIYTQQAGPIAFFTGGNNERMRIDGVGNVGIGETSPDARLDIRSSGASSYPLLIKSSDDQQLFRFREESDTRGTFYINDASESSKVTLASSGNSSFMGGNVGIGTATPSSLLELRKTSTGSITGGTGNKGAVLTLHHEAQWESAYGSGGSTPDWLGAIDFSTGDNSTGEGIRASIRTTVNNYYNTNDLVFYTANQGDTTLDERMRITETGDVGIGTSSPSDSNWGVPSLNKELAIDGTTGYAVIHLRGTGSGSTDTRFSMGVGDTKYYLAYDDVAGQHRIVVDSSGHVLVGTTNADIGGSTTGIRLGADGQLMASSSGTGTYNYPGYFDRRGTNNTGDSITLGLQGYLKSSIGVIGTSGGTDDGGITFNTWANNATRTTKMTIFSNVVASEVDVSIKNGKNLELQTTSGVARGYISAQETNTGGTHAAGLIIATSSGESITFKDNGIGGTTNMVISGAGDVSISDGNLILANGHGLDFSATPNSSASGTTHTSSLLDDYEEGYWTPKVIGSTGGVYTAGNLLGSYVKIGNLVHLTWYVTPASSVATGSIQITDLPYAASGGGTSNNRITTGSCMVDNLTLSSGKTWVHPYMSHGATAIQFYQSGTNAGWATLPVDTSFAMIGGITYRTV